MTNIDTELIPAVDGNPDPAAAGLWRSGPVGSQILRAVSTVAVLSVLARLAMAGRDLALADQFGTSDAVDAFVVAIVAPLFAIQVATGALSNAFLPILVRVRRDEGRPAGTQLIGSMVVLVAAVAAVLAGGIAVCMPVMLRGLASGFAPDKVALTRSLILALLPFLVCGALSLAWSAVLNADGHFALPSLTPAFAPLGAVVALELGPASWGIHGVAWGVSIGAVIEAIVLAGAVRARGESPWPHWHGFSPALRDVVRQYLPAAGGALLITSAVVVDQAVAASDSAGSVAALNYGGKVVSLIVSVGILAIGTVALPHLSTIAAARDWNGMRATIRSYVRLTLVVAIPLTVVVIVLARPAVSILFQHGAFTSHDTDVVTKIQVFSALQIPFQIVGIIAIRALGALRRNSALAIVGGVIVVVNLVTDVVFLHLFGVAGIALSTSCVYVASCVALYWILFRALRREDARTAGA